MLLSSWAHNYLDQIYGSNIEYLLLYLQVIFYVV